MASGEGTSRLRPIAGRSVRSGRRLIEQPDGDPVWDLTLFSKNDGRLLAGEIATKIRRAVPAQPRIEALLSDEHFSRAREDVG